MSHPVEALGLKGVTTGIVKLPPASGSTPIYRLCEKRKGGLSPTLSVCMHLCISV